MPNKAPRGFVLHYPATAEKDLGLNPDLHVTRDTPPTFLLQNEDDHVEMHLYAQGGHAFGLRRPKLPATAWPQLVDTWPATIGMCSE